MNLGPIDIFFLMFATLGPLKSAAVFAGLTSDEDDAFRRRVAWRTVSVAAIVALVFIVVGDVLLKVFHVSLAALNIAGGVILLLVALDMVLGEKKKKPDVGAGAASETIAIYPLAIPLMASPSGLVVCVTLSASLAIVPGVLYMLVSLALVMAINILVMLNIRSIVRAVGANAMLIIGKVVGILLTALAIQLMIAGLTELGLIADAGTH
jgi:multiple antibiotic resistance protein